MGKNRKRLIIISLIVAALVIVLGTIAAWRHTTLLEEIPEEIWESQISMCYIPQYRCLLFENGPILNDIEITEEELRETLSDAVVLRNVEPYAFLFPSFWLLFETEEREYTMIIQSDGYIKCSDTTYVTEVTGDVTEVVETDWYWDGGKMYTLLLDKYVRLSSILPKSAWGTVEWTHYDAEEKGIDAQGTCDPEEVCELLQVSVVDATISEIAEGYDYYTLTVSNTEWDPIAEYLITVNEIGEVHFQLQTRDDQNEVYNVLNMYYEIDPGVFQALEEMLLKSE